MIIKYLKLIKKMIWYDSKMYRGFTDFEESEEEEEEEEKKEIEDYNIDQIVNRLESKLDSVSQNAQDLPNELNNNQPVESKNITSPEKLSQTLILNQSQINNSKITSPDNSNINKTTEKDDEGDMTSVISGISIPKNVIKNNSNSISINVNLPSEVKNDIEIKKDVQFLFKNLKSSKNRNTDSDITNSQIDNSKFT